jgi:hypothetical protein
VKVLKAKPPHNMPRRPSPVASMRLDAKSNLVPEAAPSRRQRSNGLTQFKGHEHGLKRRVLYWNRIVG